MALKLETEGGMVIVSNPGIKPVWYERLLTWMDYQKVVVRVDYNIEFMEHKTPIACLTEDVLTSIGAEYGDTITIEYMGLSETPDR